MGFKELMFDAFSSCNVVNGKIMFNKQFTPYEIMDLYFQFSKDLLSANIPNIRVIGIYKSWDESHQQSSFRTNDNYGMSLIELSEAVHCIIPESIGGNDPVKGCFYGVNEELDNNPKFNEMFGQSESMKAGTRRANLLMLPSTEIGSLMQGSERPGDFAPLSNVNTSDLWYTQHSLAESASYPRMLFPNKVICDMVTGGSEDNTSIVFFIKEGTGRYDYEDTQALFKDRMNRVFPCRTSYDLSRYFTCGYPSGQNNYLQLIYRERGLDESVLTSILQRYGRTWC